MRSWRMCPNSLLKASGVHNSCTFISLDTLDTMIGRPATKTKPERSANNRKNNNIQSNIKKTVSHWTITSDIWGRCTCIPIFHLWLNRLKLLGCWASRSRSNLPSHSQLCLTSGYRSEVSVRVHAGIGWVRPLVTQNTYDYHRHYLTCITARLSHKIQQTSG